MREYRLFHIYIRPIRPKSTNEAENPEGFDFRILADTAIEALTKMMAIPDIGYMYNEPDDEIVITYDGVVY